MRSSSGSKIPASVLWVKIRQKIESGTGSSVASTKIFPIKIDNHSLRFYYGNVKHTYLSAVLAIVLVIGTVFALNVNAEPQIKTLENGMTLLLNPIEGQDSIAIVLAYHAGADAQTPQTAGLFKFLEYVFFNGPATKPGIAEPASAIDVLEPSAIEGGAGIDRFEFGFSTKKQNLVTALDTIQYLFSRERKDVNFAQPDGIELARQSARALIQNELNNSDQLANMAIDKKLFSRAPYRVDVLGADYILEKADVTALKALDAKWLVPNNACLAIAGCFDTEQLLPLIEARFGQIPKAQNPWPSTLPILPKPGVVRPTFLVFPDSSIPSGKMHVDIRYRGPDPLNTKAYQASLMLVALARDPASRFQTAVAKGLPKGSSPENVQIVYAPSRNASWLAIQSDITVPSGKNPSDLVFAFKELVRGTELYMMKVNASYFSTAQYQSARTALLEEKMADAGDPMPSAKHMAMLWGFGIPSFILQETDAIMKVGQKDIAELVDTYVQKNLEVVMVRIDPSLFEKYKKSFSNYGFETVSPQNSLWWR